MSKRPKSNKDHNVYTEYLYLIEVDKLVYQASKDAMKADRHRPFFIWNIKIKITLYLPTDTYSSVTILFKHRHRYLFVVPVMVKSDVFLLLHYPVLYLQHDILKQKAAGYTMPTD